MELKNYPSGNKEFDEWFRETQPDWAAQVDAEQESKNKQDEFFQMHETFMVRLCEVLSLDYETTSEEDILDAVKKLQEFWDK